MVDKGWGMRRIMVIPKDYAERFGDREWVVPKGYGFFADVCYEDGSPVLYKFGESFVLKVGKRKFARVIIEE